MQTLAVSIVPFPHEYHSLFLYHQFVSVRRPLLTDCMTSSQLMVSIGNRGMLRAHLMS
jgi:hypothetical protein